MDTPTYPAVVHSCGATITYQAPKIVALAAVAGLSFEVTQESHGVDDDGTDWGAPHVTRLQIVGIAGQPYMGLFISGTGRWALPTAVVDPERFGSWPADDAYHRPSSPAYRAARAWVESFAHANVTA